MSPLELPAGMLVVELQNDLCAPSLASERGLRGALARAVRERGILERLPPLLAAFRARGWPVLYATKERHPGLPQPAFPALLAAGGDAPILLHGTWGAAVVDALKPEPGDVVLPRYTSIDPSHGSELWPACERLGLRTLVVAGISTNFAVEGTVRAAANRGLRVVVLEDCCASAPDEWHAFSVENILPLLSSVTTSTALMEQLP